MERPLLMTADALHDFMVTAFPQMAGQITVEDLAPMQMTARMAIDTSHLRPGETVSGPTMFTLADCAVYLALIAMVGPEALAVTTNASMDFMRKPEAGTPLIGEVTLLKLGRGLVVGDVHIRSEGSEALVARATMTYSRPR